MNTTLSLFLMNVGLIDMIQETGHPAPPGHPENSLRLRAALKVLLASDLASGIVTVTPGETDTAAIFRVHADYYIRELEKISREGGGYFDSDTYISSGSYAAAMETASATIWAAEQIAEGTQKRFLLAGRPPGHHAERDRAMGFCLINNTAVAAEHLVDKYNFERVAIVDWDVHHGNGTQSIFYERADIMYISLHQSPLFPGTGATWEKGDGPGRGYNLNVPMAPGTGEEEYLEAFNNEVLPVLDRYCPQVVIITAGFDAHADDPLAGLNLTEKSFGYMTRALADIADKYSEGRVLSLLEGGYNPEANARSLYEHIRELQKN